MGIAFRVEAQGTRYECFYLRFTNGRPDDQLQRNHSTQYVSEPDFRWQRLRKENPGVYESYVDIEPGATAFGYRDSACDTGVTRTCMDGR